MNVAVAYKLIFNEYPDVVNSKQMAAMLGGVSVKTVYAILQSGAVQHFVIGRRYFIPKISIFRYLGIVDQ